MGTFSGIGSRLRRMSMNGLAATLLLAATYAAGATVQYADRSSFLAAVGASFTDGFDGYPSGVLTDAQMSAVVGQTRYQSISFSNLNLVGDVYVHGDGTNYCAGCNGNFTLTFDATSYSALGGIFGVGVDIVLHTSRRTSIGDVNPSETSLPGTVEVTFVDGTTSQLAVPADIGFLGPETFFLGLTDDRGIKSLTIGTEPTALRHSWVIDNLTIAGAITEPPTIWLVAVALFGGIGVVRVRNVRARLNQT